MKPIISTIIANKENQEEKKKNGSETDKEGASTSYNVSGNMVNSLNVHSPPAMFQILLKRNTNLNEPPSNWLHGSSRWQSHTYQKSFPFDNLFSSFSMANQILDLTGIVDVISDSQNIKKLLKMTLSKANVSMIVHRVNNTLLLDSFDIHSLLKQKTGTWELFRRFYYETVAEDIKLSVVERKNKSRDYLQSRNMFSKLLYYCLGDEQQSPDSQSNQSNISDSESDANILSHRTVVWNFEDIRMLIGTDLPIFGGGTHPCVSLKLRDMRKPISVLTGLDNWLDNLMCNVPELAMCYHDNGIVQSYELLKTEDIPNCPDCRFSPNVIKDIAQNILSFLKSNATKEGHTYWLFKAHDGDIVKLYDLTTLCCNDNNNIDDSKSIASGAIANPFTVPVGILFYRLARNLRLRQKCPSRGKKVRVVKKLLNNSILLLDPRKHYQVVTSCHYFLSDLFVCDHLEEESSPSESSESDIDDNAVRTGSSDDDEENKVHEKFKNKAKLLEEATASIEVKTLGMHKKPVKKQVHQNKKNKSSDLKKNDSNESNTDSDADDFKKRSSEALKHIAQAFTNIEKCDTSCRASDSTSVIDKGEFGSNKMTHFEELAQCNPNEAIPLHYASLKPDPSRVVSPKIPQDPRDSKRGGLEDGGEVCEKNYFLTRNLQNIESPFSNKTIDTNLWFTNSKIFLMRKACIVFLKRLKSKLDKSQLFAVSAFHDGIKALKCYCAFGKLMRGSSGNSNISSNNQNYSNDDLLMKCRHDPHLFVCVMSGLGDAHLKAAMTLAIGDAPVEGGSIPVEDETERDLISQINSGISDADLPCSIGVPIDTDDCYNQSLLCYSMALDIAEKFDKFQRQEESDDAGNRFSKPFYETLKRKANAHNEFGKFLFSQIVLSDGSLNLGWSHLMDEAQRHYRLSIDIFRQINDKVNTALVLANSCNVTKHSARMVRNLATSNGNTEFSDEEKEAYLKAESSYIEALKLLDNCRNNRDVRDTIKWEFVTLLVNVGCLIQDNPPLSKCSTEVVKKEVVTWLTKALDYCKFENSAKYEPAMYRRAHIHHRLASLYHKYFLDESSKQTKKKNKASSEKHYKLAYEIFSSTGGDSEFLRMQLERLQLLEGVYSNADGEAERNRLLFNMLEILVQCSEPMVTLTNMLKEICDKFFEQPFTASSSHSKSSKSIQQDVKDFISDVEFIYEAIKLSNFLRIKLSSTLLLLLKGLQTKSYEAEQFKKLKTLYHTFLTSESGRFNWTPAHNYWEDVSKHVGTFISEYGGKIESALNEESDGKNIYNRILARLDNFSKLKGDSTPEEIHSTNSFNMFGHFYSNLKFLLPVCQSLSNVLKEIQISNPKSK